MQTIGSYSPLASRTNLPLPAGMGVYVRHSGAGGRASLGVSVNQLISQTTNASEAAMSQVRVHNFSISLDGFGTGEGLTFDARSATPAIVCTSGCSPPSSGARSS